MRLVLPLLAMALVTACSSTPAPATPPPEKCPPAAVQVTLNATDRVNPSPDGEGRPVQVRVYLLVSDARLRNATFEEIWQDDKAVLAEDVQSMSEHTVFPGKTAEVTLKRNPDASFLAVVALFREPQGKDWFISYELEPTTAEPPCPEASPLPVLLDRMQIQDGEGRTELQDAATDASPPPAAAEEASETGESAGEGAR